MSPPPARPQHRTIAEMQQAAAVMRVISERQTATRQATKRQIAAPRAVITPKSNTAAMPTPRTPLADQIAAEFGQPRSLGDIVAAMPGLTNALQRHPRADPGGGIGGHATASIHNLLVSNPGIQHGRAGIPQPLGTSTPLIDAVTVYDGIKGSVMPVTVAMTNTADVVAEGVAGTESTITYTPTAWTKMPTISHFMPITTQAVEHNATLRADVNMFMSSGILVKLETRIGAALTAATAMVAHAYDTSVAKTIRTAIAAAQSAFPELGPGPVTVVLSPADHATLDLANLDLARWPARIVSAPAVATGTAYVGRLSLAVRLFTSVIEIGFGTIDDQFVTGTTTVRANLDALAHVSAPSAIVKADLTP